MRIAIVIPWFGRELKGGAEQHAWQIASRLAGRGHSVEALTTCCRSHQDDWSTNHLPEGLFRESDGFAIRRFPVDTRNRAEFDRVCSHLLSLDAGSLRPGVSPVARADSHIFATELIKSSALLQFLTAHQDAYDSFIFLPYLYGPILDGVRIVGRKASLQPCLHDEAYAYLPEVEDAFRIARSLLFISEGEQELALRLFGPGIWEKSSVTGAGVETSPAESAKLPDAIDSSSKEKFLLYLGRKDPGKNVPLLLRAFARFRSVRPNSSLRLVLAGHGKVDLNGCHDVVSDLGLVSDEEKERLLHQCCALVQPSQNESFSRVIMEAWFRGKPVAAHGRCLATAVAVERSGGGWIAETETEWARLLTEIDRSHPGDLSKLGASGKQYAEKMAEWDSVIDRYEAALDRQVRSHRSLPKPRHSSGSAINQFLPNLAHGDAISNEAIFIRNQLRALGFSSDIYVRFIDPRVADECRLFTSEAMMESAALIYHHSIGTEITPHILRYDGPKCLIYHNITPPEFFEPYRPEFASVLRQGREELPNLAAHFQIALGDSTFNARELADAGFTSPEVLPICVDPEKWNLMADPGLMQTLQDGRTNIIFVGRISPNKRQDDLIGAFRHYLSFDSNARLILIGAAEEGDPYVARLHDLIKSLGLLDNVILPGNIAEAQLAAYYRTADLFWSMSEHEGFCVPLIEAMWFDIPVLAFRTSAVPETLGEAAFMFHDKESVSELAAAARIVLTDQKLSEKIISAQRKAREKFLPMKILPLIADLARNLATLAPLNRHAPAARC